MGNMDQKGRQHTILGRPSVDRVNQYLDEIEFKFEPKFTQSTAALAATGARQDENREIVENWDNYLQAKSIQFKNDYLQRVFPKLGICEFFFLRTIGQGLFGTIMLAINKSDRKPYAIKILDKEELIKRKCLTSAQTEKRVLQAINFPFTVFLEFFIQDNSYLYLGMPFIPGGDMYSLMKNVYYLTEDEAKFYAAQVLLTFEYLHHVGIIYRDLKPENLLINHDGYLKVTDFGCAKLIGENGRTYSMCGTVDYISPEMLNGTGHGMSADWWMLGVYIFDMCYGITPFHSPNLEKMCDRILSGKFHTPYHFTGQLKDLIEHLLQTDVSKRIGCLINGVDDIKKHAWFSTIDWLAIINKQVKPVYLPDLRSPADDRFFDEFDTDVLVVASKDRFKEQFNDF